MRSNKPRLPPGRADVLEPVFRKMSRDDLMKKCKRGTTQNSNESFHNVIWSILPKSRFCSAITAALGVGLAVCQYNDGRSKGLLRCLEAVTHTSAGPRSRASFLNLDNSRVKRSIRVSTAAAKRRRSHLAMLRSRQERANLLTEGGPSYAPALAEEISDEEVSNPDTSLASDLSESDSDY